jgi:dihydroneopterin aldolase
MADLACSESARLTIVAQVFLHGIEFYGYHGVPDAERTVGHRYLVDVELEVDERASQSDRVEDTVDYSQIGLLVVEHGMQPGVSTVERLAQVIADAILARYRRVQQVTITVAKPYPPMPVIAQQAGVTLTQDR